MAEVKRAIVVGGGISGMTVAVALKRQGVDVHLVEKCHHADQLGTGINLQNNALRALHQVGVLQECVDSGFGWNTVTTRDAHGSALNTVSLPWEERPGMPGALGIMRTTLADILARHAKDAGVELSYNTTVTAIDQDSAGVTATLSDGRVERADILIAADGVYSNIRDMIFGREFAPVYAGQSAWRYTVRRPASLEGFTIYRTEAGESLGCLPLSDTTAYYFSLDSTAERVRYRQDELADEMAKRLAVFDAPELREAAEQVHEGGHISFRPFDIFLMPQPWHRGRVVLLGDAAHSFTPQLTSGGGMAIESAVVLAEELCGRSAVEDALRAFNDRRRERVKLIYDNSLRICEIEKLKLPDKSEGVKLLVSSMQVLQTAY